MIRIRCADCKNKDCGNSGTGLTVAACSGFSNPKPITNYDRLISKTPEEMAEFLCHTVSPSGVINCSSCEASEFCRMGHNGWLSWLKSPAERESTT